MNVGKNWGKKCRGENMEGETERNRENKRENMETSRLTKGKKVKCDRKNKTGESGIKVGRETEKQRKPETGKAIASPGRERERE